MKAEDYKKRFVALPMSECTKLARFVQLTQEGLSMEDALKEVGGMQAETSQLLRDMIADEEMWQLEGPDRPE